MLYFFQKTINLLAIYPNSVINRNEKFDAKVQIISKIYKKNNKNILQLLKLCYA
jgi:hypothetical protein